MAKNFVTFINDLKDEETFNKYGPSLALLDIGNFDGLVLFGKKMGYTFTKEDVQQFLASMGSNAGGPTTETLALQGGTQLTSPKAPNAYLSQWIGK